MPLNLGRRIIFNFQTVQYVQSTSDHIHQLYNFIRFPRIFQLFQSPCQFLRYSIFSILLQNGYFRAIATLKYA